MSATSATQSSDLYHGPLGGHKPPRTPYTAAMPGRTKPLHTAYLALGSNLSSRAGSPEETLRAGLRAVLAALPAGSAFLAASSLYRTDPVGLKNQPAFLNAAASLRSALGPEPLLQLLGEVERTFGRDRQRPHGAAPPRNGPRTLDLDLLLVDDLVLSTHALTLPHPRLHDRRFVLAPLAEIAPDLRHPVLGASIEELLDRLPDAGEQARAGVCRLGAALLAAEPVAG